MVIIRDKSGKFAKGNSYWLGKKGIKKANSGSFKKNQKPWNKGKRTFKICLNCGKEFSTNKGAMTKPKQKFCLNKCSSEYRHKNNNQPKCLVCRKYCQKCYKKENHHWWKGGRPKCIKCGKLLTYRAKLCNLHYLEQQFKNKSFTNIEKILYKELKIMGIIFEKQKLINKKFIVDAYIPAFNLIIEADGSYWHSLTKIKYKDKSENAYLKKCGFNILRLNELEIKNGKFLKRLGVFLN